MQKSTNIIQLTELLGGRLLGTKEYSDYVDILDCQGVIHKRCPHILASFQSSLPPPVRADAELEDKQRTAKTMEKFLFFLEKDMLFEKTCILHLFLVCLSFFNRQHRKMMIK